MDSIEIIINQVTAIRDSGVVNMFDFPSVKKIARKLKFHELERFIDKHPQDYFNFIMSGDLSFISC